MVESLSDELRQLELVCSKIGVSSITMAGKEISWKRTNDSQLRVDLPKPFAKGRKVTLESTAKSANFEFTQDQKLVAEMAVFGQIREASSFSSHVFYYPVDKRNDAAVKMTISVPEGYVAVTGGEKKAVVTKDGRSLYSYESKVRTRRALPFGFAVGKYESLSAKTDGGLQVEIYYLAGKEKEARQHLDVARKAGTMLEEWMGPLPWRRVAFCHVRPFRKETGVSLPGLVLFSDGFFKDFGKAKLSGSNLEDSRLLIADELSHQWNFYAVSLPNELAEGVSTFTNILYVENRTNAEEFRKGIEYCAKSYIGLAELVKDFALADPALYKSDVYRVVAFRKVPAVFALLRNRLGTEKFKTAWRATFEALRGKNADYKSFVSAFSKASGQELTTFFDEWFFQAGHPRLAVRWSTIKKDNSATLRIEVEQVQPGGLYTIGLDLRADCGEAGPVTLESLPITKRRQVFFRKLPGAAARLSVEAEGNSPLIKLESIVGPTHK